jgi:hypothetical protein
MRNIFFTLTLLFISLFFLILVNSLFFNSITEYKKIIHGGWVVTEINIDKQNAMSNFSTNLISFQDKGKCTLPLPSETIEINYIAKWELLKKDNIFYLKIFNSSNEIFNGQYKVKLNIEGDCKLMILESERIKLVCSKLINPLDRL